MMDSRHQNQDGNQHSHNFAFNPSHNDTFNSFLHADNEPSFNNSWDPDAFVDPQDSINGFNPGNTAWDQSALQSSHLVPVSNYGVQPRSLDQTFSGNPSSFNYSNFDSRANLSIAPTSDSTWAYGHVPLADEPSFDFTRSQTYQRPSKQAETISPQALQNYPAAFNHVQIPEPRPSQQFSQPVSSGRQASTGGNSVQATVTRHDWRSIVSAIPEGTSNGVFTSRNPSELTSATNSTHFKGFTFVGNNKLELSTTKATLPKYNRRRSKNEIWQLLLQEKGSGTWSPARGPVLKKLKKSPGRQTGTRPIASSATSQGLSTLESTSSPESISDSDPDDDSAYSSGSEEETEPEEPSPLPQNRPTDLSKAIEYDAVKAVWAPRNKILSVAAIRTALGDFWAVVKGIRDRWKSEMLELQQAEPKKNQQKINQLTNSLVEQRRLLDSCIRLTLTHGHQDITEKFGENPQLLLVFYQFTADRFKDGEYGGSLINSMLELMTRCTTLDLAVLAKTKIDKVLPRLVKKGDEEGKELAQRILSNAAANSKQKDPDGKLAHIQEAKEKDGKTSAFAKPSVDPSRVSNAVPGVKKPRATDNLSPQPVKKLSNAVSASSGAVPAKSTSLLGKRQQPAKVDPKAAVKSTPANAPPKVKNNHISAKPSGFFSSLQSASKKPGTSNAALLSAKSKEGKESVLAESKSTAAVPAATKPTFSFAETMANLNKQKEVKLSKPEESGPPETPEEKIKRERKLERRKLRVSFKPDSSLVEIRTFVHDPEEEIGHEDSLVRDVGDSRGEGQMLKMHKDLDLMDEDEDGAPSEESFGIWKTPSLVDFSVVEKDELDRNCETKGGKLEVKSPERAVQEQRELTTLMVIYTTSSDIPSSPREPVDPYTGEGDGVNLPSFGEPNEETRAREAQYYGAQSLSFRPASNPPTATQPQPDIAALLQIISSQQQSQQQPQQQSQQQQPPQSQPQPATQASTSGLEAIFAQFSANNQQAVPVQMQQPSHPTTTFDLQATLAAFSMGGQARPVYGQPPPIQPNLQSLLSQLNQQGSTQMQNYGYGSTYQADNDRKRTLDYEDQGNGEYGVSKGKRQKAETGKKKFYGVPRLPCKFWQDGKCRKGDDCTFLHE